MMTVVINGTTGIDTGTGSLIAASSTTPTYLDLFEDTDNGSNYVRLIAPTSVTSNQTITLPDGTGTVAVNGVNGVLVSGTAITLTNQTAPEFTSIPSWAKRVTLIFSNVSTNGSSVPQIRLGAGSIDATSYSQGNGQVVNAAATVASVNPTTGFALNGNSWSSTVVVHGKLEFVLLDSSTNLWVVSGVLGRSDAGVIVFLGGSKTLGGSLDRIRVTTVNGTDQYKSGQLNIMWE
jgi:hypothetical protein